MTPARPVIVVLRSYQRWISPLWGPRCRFFPTCSSYALTALEGHGLVRGGWLAARRLVRCHPFHPGGHDPVPATRSPSVPRKRSSSGTMGRSPAPATAPALTAPAPRT